jgi:hemolysin-activating ACP:hemolysin acyltransferase
MPAFAKNPRFIVGAIIVLWVAYVLYANFQLTPIEIRIIPFIANLQLRVSAVIIGAAIFGIVATLAIQWLWRRRSSKNGSSAAAASSRTVA